MKRILIYSVSFTLLLFLFRVIYTGSILFLFIPWNLFLAWLPLLFSSKIKSDANKFKNGILYCLWLLFFPNAPYLITDLFHLHLRTGVPLYFDLILLFTASWNGILMGFLSIQNIEYSLLNFISNKKIKAITMLSFFLCGFGIYLGRFERYNSWHLLTQPVDLLKDIAVRFIKPWDHPRTWAVTFLFALSLFLIYETLKKIPAHFSEQGFFKKL